MKRVRWSTLFLILVWPLCLASCASCFKRKDCEKTNWFQHGHDVAMRGERVNNDSFVHECQRVEAEIDYAALSSGFKQGMDRYCQPETVHATGKRGEFFNPELCDGDKLRLLKKRHHDGVLEYCDKGNGYAAGATGKKYNNICPKELEAAFMPEFNRGRKAYLTAQVAKKEAEIGDTDREIADLERRRSALTMELHSVNSLPQVRRERVTSGSGQTQTDTIVVEEDPAVKSRKDRILQNMQTVDHEISRKRKRQEELRKDIRDANAEISTL